MRRERIQPVLGRRRHGQQLRKITQHPLDDREHGLGRRDADVDVYAVDEHGPSPPLGAVDEPRVALALRERLASGTRERVGAGAEQPREMGLCRRADQLDDVPEFGHGLVNPVVHARGDLDRVQQKLLAQPGAQLGMLSLNLLQDAVSCRHEHTGDGIHKGKLPLDPECRAL